MLPLSLQWTFNLSKCNNNPKNYEDWELTCNYWLICCEVRLVEFPTPSMSGTRNDGIAANSAEVLHSYLYIASGILKIANYDCQTVFVVAWDVLLVSIIIYLWTCASLGHVIRTTWDYLSYNLISEMGKNSKNIFGRIFLRCSGVLFWFRKAYVYKWLGWLAIDTMVMVINFASALYRERNGMKGVVLF